MATQEVILTDLAPLSRQLNAATDELNLALQAIQEKVNAFSLGVEVWLDDDPSHDLSRHVTNTWSELDGQVVREWSDGEAEFVDEWRTIQVQQLGYGRLGDGWMLLVRLRRGPERKGPSGWQAPDQAQWSDAERKPLLRTARNVRVKAVDLIPALIGALRRQALKRFSDSPCTAWARRGTSACTNAGGPMQAYSMDLRERALLDSDAGMKAADVAVKYRVSGSWVRLLKQRRRETGEVAPRVQRHGRRRMLEPHLHTLAALIAEQPDRTLAELKDALGTPASLATIWRAVAALDVTVKKNGPALRTRST